MSSLVIVAIPAEDDVVWKVSSEKVPHLTLMYLGEIADEDAARAANRMAEFVEHALNVNQHGPFYLDVDYRGELGPDNADVLFFENGWDSRWIKSLRGQLLQQNDIRTAFEANDQYPEWVPHLTLGYPDEPAKELDGDPNPKFFGVQFDRIAVWTGDFEGPEFRLKWPDRNYEDGAMAIHQQKPSLEEALEHFGVKGMKWGQRKEESVITKPKSNLTEKQKWGYGAALAVPTIATAGSPIGLLAGFGIANLHPKLAPALKKDRAESKAFKKDKAWEKEFKKDKRYADVHNDMADHMNSWLPGYNKKYDGIDLTQNAAKMKEYEAGYFKEQDASFARSYSKIYGESPSGNYKVSVIPGTTNVVLHNKLVDPSEFNQAKHAADQEEPLMVFHLTQDPDTWHILKVEPVTDSMAQTVDLGEQYILEHFGVKGMKWGVRKENIKSGAKAVGRGISKVSTALADANFESATTSTDGTPRAALDIEHKANQAFKRTDLPAINSKPEYESARKLRNRLRHPRDPLTKQYRKEVKETYIQRLESAANSMHNASGTRQYTIRERGWELPPEGGALPKSKHYWSVTTREIQHAEDYAAGTFSVELTLDEDGFVTDINPVDPVSHAMTLGEQHILEQIDPIQHAVELGEAFVVHYGVKGMKWGQRKDRNEPGLLERRRAQVEAVNREKRPSVTPRVQDSIGSSARKKTTIKAKGGEDHPASEDAIRVAEAEQKLKKSGVHALSNKELQDLATRMNLENQVHTLQKKRPSSKGREFVNKMLGLSGDKKAKKNKGGGSSNLSKALGVAKVFV